MIYGLRVCHGVLDRLTDMLKRFDTITLKLWDKHGIKQAGFWTVLVGESNQDLYYLLKWETLAEREQKFGAFGVDPEWLSARAGTEQNGPIVATSTNTLLSATRFSSVKSVFSPRRHEEATGVPGQAGIHVSAAWTPERWVPGFAGTAVLSLRPLCLCGESHRSNIFSKPAQQAS